MAALETMEVGLIGPVAFIAMTTHGTRAGCVTRGNKDHVHTCLCGFVSDKRSQLPKCPGVAHPTLRASNRNSFPNPVQVFERECLTLTGGLLKKRLADAMVRVFLEAVFSFGCLAQPPAGSAGACQLQVAALEIAQDKLPDHAACQRVQADPIQAEEPIGTGIVANAAVGGEGWAGLGDNLSGITILPLGSRTHGPYRFCRLVPGAARQLRAQAVGHTRLAIDEVVQLVLIRNALVPRDRRAVACRRIKRGLGLTQSHISRHINGKFTTDGSYGEWCTHRESIPQIERPCKYALKRVKAWRSSRRRVPSGCRAGFRA